MILPQPTATTQPFWDAAARHRLLLRRCPGCARWLHPQLTFCGCGHTALEWQEASGDAVLVSYAVARRAPVPALQADLPFTLLLVRTHEGPQLVSALPGDGHTLHCGMPMRVSFPEPAEGITRVYFAPCARA